jgi:tetratricopeptide (TPR) repeat protein
MIARQYRTILVALCITLPLAVTLPLHGDSAKTSADSNSDASLGTNSEKIKALVTSWQNDKSHVTRMRVLRELVKLGTDARDAIRAAAKASSSNPERELLELASIKVLAGHLAVVIGKHQESQLVFDGQYSHLRDDDNKENTTDVTNGLFHVLNDEEVPDFIRLGSINALADVADKGILTRVRDLERDPLLEPEIATQLGLLMAIFGDTRRVDRRVSRLLKNTEHTDPLRSLDANVELANIYYRIRHYDEAVERYVLIVETYGTIRRGLQRNSPTHPLLANRFSDEQMALQYYNASCSNSLAGKVSDARRLLRQAIELDPIHLTNVSIDGDLKNLREAEGHAEFLIDLQGLVDEEAI